MTYLSELERFAVKQRITMMVNRYEIRELTAEGAEGDLLALAQQKRMAFKEEVTFFADEDRKIPVFSFKARHLMDPRATYDVRDADGNDIGWFRKEFGKSLLRSTWRVGADGLEAVGRERRLAVAIGRRAWESMTDFPSPFVFHFDLVDDDGNLVMTSERRRSIRDQYRVEVPGARLDGRVAAAMSVALDAMQSR